jgi:hypothetical protein
MATDSGGASSGEEADPVLTPGGLRPRDRVQPVGPGEAVRRDPDGTYSVVPAESSVDSEGEEEATSEPKHHEEARSSLERGSTVADDLVLTPGGYRPKSVVHAMEPGHYVSGKNGRLQVLQPDGGVVVDLGPLPVRPAGVPLHPGNEMVPTEKVPGLGGGWITFASWTNNTGKPITSFTTTWRVPPGPTTQSGQTIFLFNGIQNSTMIYQPVLQWGPSAAGGGNNWAIASWYVDGPGGAAFHSSLTPVSVGQVLVGIMTLTGQSGSDFSYNCQFQGIANSGYAIQNVQQLTWLIETLEAYGITKCSDYPASPRMAMTAIEIKTSNGDVRPNWQASNSITDCGQHTTVVNDASPGGEVDIFFAPQSIYKFNGNEFVQVAGSLTHISVGADGTVWGINAASDIYRFNTTTGAFQQVSGLLTSISVGNSTAVWGINAASDIYRFNTATGAFQQVSGLLTSISVGADGTVWGINAASEIYRFNTATGAFQHVSGLLTSISVGDSTAVWGINAASEIYRFNTATGAFQQVSGLLASISVGGDGAAWGIN